MDSPKLPHLRGPQSEPEEFISMEHEIAKIFSKIHPESGSPEGEEDSKDAEDKA